MITVYGAEWCEDTRRLLRLLRRLHVRHRYLDVDADLPTLERARALGGGGRRTPTIDLGMGGPALVEPTNEVLTAALVEQQMLTVEDAQERLDLQNVGDIERIGRTFAGAALMVIAGSLAPPARLPLRVLGGAVAASGVLGWCPVYYAGGVSSIGGPGDRPDEAERRGWLARRARSSGVEAHATER